MTVNEGSGPILDFLPHNIAAHATLKEYIYASFDKDQYHDYLSMHILKLFAC